MADDKTRRGAPDSQHINLVENYEVSYWTKTLGVTADQLRRAVAAVGNSTAAVRSHLGK